MFERFRPPIVIRDLPKKRGEILVCSPACEEAEYYFSRYLLNKLKNQYEIPHYSIKVPIRDRFIECASICKVGHGNTTQLVVDSEGGKLDGLLVRPTHLNNIPLRPFYADTWYKAEKGYDLDQEFARYGIRVSYDRNGFLYAFMELLSLCGIEVGEKFEENILRSREYLRKDLERFKG